MQKWMSGYANGVASDRTMIRSHIIPKFYLKQFAFEKPNSKYYVYLYEKGKKPADRWIKRVGYELGYFGYVLPDGTFEESLEVRLKALEEDSMEALVSANGDFFVFTHSNRRKLAFYAALLYSRTTQRFEWNKKNWLEVYRQLDSVRACGDNDSARNANRRPRNQSEPN
jgi:hypothetical protein